MHSVSVSEKAKRREFWIKKKLPEQKNCIGSFFHDMLQMDYSIFRSTLLVASPAPSTV